MRVYYHFSLLHFVINESGDVIRLEDVYVLRFLTHVDVNAVYSVVVEYFLEKSLPLGQQYHVVYKVSMRLFKLFQHALGIVMRFACGQYLIYAVVSVLDELAIL